jgi:hypothetical protein
MDLALTIIIHGPSSPTSIDSRFFQLLSDLPIMKDSKDDDNQMEFNLITVITSSGFFMMFFYEKFLLSIWKNFLGKPHKYRQSDENLISGVNFLRITFVLIYSLILNMLLLMMVGREEGVHASVTEFM